MAGQESDEGQKVSRPATIEDLKRVCEKLNLAGVKYVLIGGFAVNYHGYFRGTQDIDFLVDTSESNIDAFRKALAFLPDGASMQLALDDVEKYTVVRIADEIVIDVLGSVGDLNYGNAESETYDLEGVEIPVATLETMIASKRTVREKDKKDLQFLLMAQREDQVDREFLQLIRERSLGNSASSEPGRR